MRKDVIIEKNYHGIIVVGVWRNVSCDQKSWFPHFFLFWFIFVLWRRYDKAQNIHYKKKFMLQISRNKLISLCNLFLLEQLRNPYFPIRCVYIFSFSMMLLICKDTKWMNTFYSFVFSTFLVILFVWWLRNLFLPICFKPEC